MARMMQSVLVLHDSYAQQSEVGCFGSSGAGNADGVSSDAGSNYPYASGGSYSPCSSSGGGPVRRGWPVWLQVVLGVLLAVLLLGGVVAVGPVKDKIYMRNVMHSAEGDHAIRATLKNMDPHAFTDEGVIHSYVIDDGTLEHNPMGGIMVTVYVNGDRSLDINATYDRPLNTEGGRDPLVGGGVGGSAKLDDLVEENKKRLDGGARVDVLSSFGADVD
ncbi:hypothetical protein FHX77_001012 [Bifidobacterium commune]|uniref:Uncharacterized protein n=1 Tax=Bifidobacterium commune TaxID=1505727 RepID=A0A1C4H7G9_9BIFI|nr:DUF1310 family protein [Bifidobacterium commune]MBB2955588.1 hypothetical protein [Bifidobacterium commune]SCC80681.1 Protein of unknown function [Bifidobacterium commune]